MLTESEVYETSPVKRTRRTSDQLEELLSQIQTILAGEPDRITIRHLYYRLVGLGSIPKTEPAYKNLCQHLTKWRRSRDISFSDFIDGTRWHIKDRTFDGVTDALENTVTNYRRDLWSTQNFYVEVWVEKDAVASIVSSVANSFGVPVFVCRGFASVSSLSDAAETFRAAGKNGKTCVIYHLGDYDPSGVAAGESVKKAMRDDFNADVMFVRIAVTPEQIENYNLPTRPTKESSHSKNWTGGDCVELDAMSRQEIEQLVESSITKLIDQREWNTLKKTEELERAGLTQFFANWRSAA
jgi:hypothetical protein